MQGCGTTADWLAGVVVDWDKFGEELGGATTAALAAAAAAEALAGDAGRVDYGPADFDSVD